MQYEERFPYAVTEVEHSMLPTSDGVRLAARLWLPAGAENSPVPALLEFVPYGKRLGTLTRDEMNHGYFAGHGYACARVDLRGSGDSEGLLTDEYTERELDDAEDIIRWLRAQPWCNGRVGMLGISWGGFNALQVAARRPAGLGGVITVCSSDDRYADDVHYMGGCLLGDNLSWAATMLAHSTLPPDPDLTGDGWREQWRRRLEEGSDWLTQWLTHQRRDAYWRHGSVCESYGDVEVPVFAVSGWADGYSNAVFRLLENLSCPRLGLVGPWGHKYPHMGVPGPDIGFLQEALRFWDHCLKDRDNGILDEPRLRAWLQDSVEPATAYEVRPGRWVAEQHWPSPNCSTLRFETMPYALVSKSRQRSNASLVLRSPLTLGEFAGKWCSFSALPQLPPDQRHEDGGALVFDSEPLEATVDVLGAPEVVVEFSSDQPVALLAGRLSDVRLDRAVTRVTYGVLNLTHRDDHAEPTPLVPGTRYRVKLRMNDVAHRFPAGHRIRLALSTSYWPLIWAPPKMATLTIMCGATELSLPVRRSGVDEADVNFGPPRAARPSEVRQVVQADHAWRVIRDLVQDCSTHEVLRDGGTQLLMRSGTTVSRKVVERYSVSSERADSARGEAEWVCTVAKPHSEQAPNWTVEVRTRLVLTSDAENFYVDADVDAYEGSRRVFARSNHDSVRRDLL